MNTTNNDLLVPDEWLADYPALAALRLTDADLCELSQQGFVCPERRGDRTYYKLRFRRIRQQVVRYIGGDAKQAAAVRRELDRLQAPARTLQELAAVTQTAKRMLRESKLRLAPLLPAAGLAFHGLAIRRPRRPTAASQLAPQQSELTERKSP